MAEGAEEICSNHEELDPRSKAYGDDGMRDACGDDGE